MFTQAYAKALKKELTQQEIVMKVFNACDDSEGSRCYIDSDSDNISGSDIHTFNSVLVSMGIRTGLAKASQMFPYTELWIYIPKGELASRLDAHYSPDTSTPTPTPTPT